ncbi:universal stress protein [Vibrio sp. CAU 1672]|uniref:universal stress protein n=1 Tax=Vibrio sp. CAU 1672 TaxID=3032594 RepID=UPI0023DB5540|nr:universal stress protein [Vibrio sp. CAU 1672]MDF2153844.1 universal stress protein [Vibrio sp. CAU 1672]
MKKFKNILFTTQGLTDDNESLTQAISLSANNQAQLQALVVCPALPDNMVQYQETYENSLYESLYTTIRAIQEQQQFTEHEVSFPVRVVSGEKPAVRIIQHIQHHSHDLLIKSAEPLEEDDDGFKAIDMTLLRKCPCPVWLNRPIAKPHHHRRVAVAIDPVVTAPETKALCLRLLELARSIADTCDSRLHIISCWEYQLEHYLQDNVWIKVPEEELNAEIESAKVKHREALQALIDESGLSGEFLIHHLHGTADTEIPDCVEREEIDVLVMGTLARSGIPGFVIGNTAENILQSVNCSLVALKPQGFVSPIS